MTIRGRSKWNLLTNNWSEKNKKINRLFFNDVVNVGRMWPKGSKKRKY